MLGIYFISFFVNFLKVVIMFVNLLFESIELIMLILVLVLV